jgi:accessory gene regulator B
MIKKMAGHLSGALANRGIFPAEDTAVYTYGLELVIASVSGVILVFVISLLFWEPLSWFFFLLSFIPMRLTAGGYHAKTHLLCNIVFGVSYTVFMLVPVCLSDLVTPAVLICASFVSLLVTFILSPVEAKNKPLSDQKRILNRRKSLILSFAFLLIAAGSILVGNTYFKLILFFIMGQFAASLSLIAAKLFNKD